MKISIVKDHIKNLEASILPSEISVIKIINAAKQLLISESNFIKLKSPICVFGDIHGQFYDLMSVMDKKKSYLFLGDFVDRGYNSIETILILLLYKLENPKRIFLLKGNHESKDLTKTYGFKDECLSKYSIAVWIKFCKLFDFMSPCAIIDNKYFCVHGGLSARLDLKKINLYDRTQNKNFTDLYWSDPSSENGMRNSPRGAGYNFGKDVFLKFMKAHGFQFMIRSHQLVFSGYKEMFDKKLLVVWSAPNYCYKQGNKASYLLITKDGHKPFYFDRCKVQYRNNKVL